MRRIDLHIVRSTGGWRLQNSDAKTLAVFRTMEAALECGETRALQQSMRGLHVRMIVHHAGKSPKIFEFPAKDGLVESYALTRCWML